MQIPAQLNEVFESAYPRSQRIHLISRSVLQYSHYLLISRRKQTHRGHATCWFTSRYRVELIRADNGRNYEQLNLLRLKGESEIESAHVQRVTRAIITRH